jgi:hypothetical protein
MPAIYAGMTKTLDVQYLSASVDHQSLHGPAMRRSQSPQFSGQEISNARIGLKANDATPSCLLGLGSIRGQIHRSAGAERNDGMMIAKKPYLRATCNERQLA